MSEESQPDSAMADLPPDADSMASWSTPPQAETGGSGGFIWLMMAMLLVVTAGVYVFGSVMRASEEAAVAQEQAERTLKDYDPNEFTSELEPSESIPLADPQTALESEPPAEPAEPAEPAGPAADGAEPPIGPHPGVEIDPANIAMAFVSRVPGGDYGRVGYLDFDGERVQTQLECARVDLNVWRGVCLSASSGISGSGQGLITDPALVPTTTFGLTTPSRAAVSPSGSIVAWTGFTLGHSYLEPGEFATLTQLISIERRQAADLETSFSTYDADGLIRDADRNYWGVSFVDEDRFFATVGFDGETAIVEGRISTSRLDVVFENATCPEVSPDGSTVVAKEQRGDHFQLVAIDVATGSRRDLGERRSIDDQVEWLDEDTIVYAVPNPDEGTVAQPVFDIWVVDTEPGAEPRLVVPFADSPAVV
jgi:hypothetical protein